MGRYLTATEHQEIDARLATAREKWVGRVLDYGEYERTVVEVAWDDAKQRIILHAKGHGENGYTPEPESKWEV